MEPRVSNYNNYQQGRLLLLSAGRRFWSPSVPERIRFRLCVLTFRCLNATAPSYLADSICRVADVEGRRHLRSSATATLIVPPVRRLTLGDRSFSVAAPRAWNSLPSAVRVASSLTTFRRELKTFLFHSSFLDH